MKKLTFIALLAFALSLLTVSVAFALPQLPDNQGIVKAKVVSPVIDDQGQVVPQPPESQLTKVVFIRHATGFYGQCDEDSVCEAKENWKSCPSDCQKGGGGEEPPAPTCYGFLSGAKPHWNWVESYAVDNTALIASAASAVSTWDAVTSATIFGSRVSGAGTWGVYDQKNSILFGTYSEPDVIAVTAIWYQGKNIYEYDILFDTEYFPGDGSIDLNSVVLHEFGHGAGLDDLYDSVCSTEVMYGYYHDVDLDLGSGDTTGIRTLYGN